MKVCVLIPAYNDERTIGPLIESIRERGLEVLVIDDGSHDATLRIAQSSGCPVIIHKRNKGKGRTLRDGFSYALENGYDAVITMDADGQHSCSDIAQFLEKAKCQAVEIIIGDRMSRAENMPLIRRVTNRLMSGLISVMTGESVPDTQCGFKLIKRGVIENMVLSSNKFEIDSEIILSAAKKGYRIHSVPVKSIYEDEESRIKPITDTFRFIRLALKYLME